MIKKIFNYVIGGITLIFGFLFGIERFKRKKVESKLEETSERLKKSEMEKNATQEALNVTKNVTDKIQVIDDEKNEKIPIDNLIDNWNNGL